MPPLTKHKIVFITAVVFTLLFTACGTHCGCLHNFTYQGKISGCNPLVKDTLLIRFDNLGSVIFNTQNKDLMHSAMVDTNGYYKVEGNFFADCSSDKNIFEKNDSLAFQLISKGHIIKAGKFCLLKTQHQYTDTAYRTTITLPQLKIE